MPLVEADDVDRNRDRRRRQRSDDNARLSPRNRCRSGPAASQIAIKQLGTNGGGYYDANSAHPFENPTPLTNLLEVLAILLIPAALCYTFGKMVGDRRQGWALLAAMLVIFVPLLLACTMAEQAGNPALAALGVDQSRRHCRPAATWKARKRASASSIPRCWATATTAASNGSVNAMHDSFTPLGGLVPMWLMQLGEVIFGGVGSGLYGMLAFAIVAVFIAGLMVGRTPEYLGKKIEAYEMKMASLVVLIPCALVVIGTAIARARRRPAPPSMTTNPGVHGFSEILYALSSAANNNGSAFGGTVGEHAVLQRAARHLHVLRAFSACDRHARDRRITRGEETRAGCRRARCRRTRRCSSCCSPCTVIVDRRADVPARAGTRADRRTTHDLRQINASRHAHDDAHAKKRARSAIAAAGNPRRVP